MDRNDNCLICLPCLQRTESHREAEPMSEINTPNTCVDSRASLPECKHTPCPSDYVAWHDWAERKAKTHTQHRCPTCGRFAVWKRARADSPPTVRDLIGLVPDMTGALSAEEYVRKLRNDWEQP